MEVTRSVRDLRIVTRNLSSVPRTTLLVASQQQTASGAARHVGSAQLGTYLSMQPPSSPCRS